MTNCETTFGYSRPLIGKCMHNECKKKTDIIVSISSPTRTAIIECCWEHFRLLEDKGVVEY